MTILAAAAILSGGGSLFSCTEVRAAVDTAKVLQQVLQDGNTDKLSTEEKAWYDNFFGGKTLGADDNVLTEAEKKWVDTMSGKITNPENKTMVIGDKNVLYSTTGVETVVGAENQFSNYSTAVGYQNQALGDHAAAFGRSNSVFGGYGVAIGYSSIAGPYEAKQDRSDAIAIGMRAYASGFGISLGGYSVAMGTQGIALGYDAQAGKPELKDLWTLEPWNGYDSTPYYQDLQTNFPKMFGEWVDGETAVKTVEPIIFEHYKTYLSSIGINSLEDLHKKDEQSRLLRRLGWQMAMTKDNVNYPIAIGMQAHAYSNGALALGTGSEVLGDYGAALGFKAQVGKDVNNGVALGAYSKVDTADFANGKKAPFSEITLSGKGTNVNGINEYLLGPVSIGMKVTGNTTSTYLRQLKYLADGTDDTDAVNLRQLKEAVKNSSGSSGGGNQGGGGNTGSGIVYEAGENITITDGKNDHTKVISATGITEIKDQVKEMGEKVNTLDGRISNLDGRVDKVGAGAAALAALHPLDYDPDDKLDVAAGYGHYAGASAVALGAYYRPNEDIMFSIGGSFGNGEEMMNAGVSVKVGSGKSGTTTSKAAMAKRIGELQQITISQQEQLKEQKDYMARQDERMARQEEEIQKLKEIIGKMTK